MNTSNLTQRIKRTLGIGLLLAGTAAPLHAQTKVIKRQALRGNDYGVGYTLPKSEIKLYAIISHTTKCPGKYYKYAERLLQLKEYTTEYSSIHTLEKVAVNTVGVPDPQATFMVHFKVGTTAPYAILTKDNLLCAINTETQPTAPPVIPIPDDIAAVATDPTLMSEEILQAGSIAKMAELTAQRLYEIRERRNEILMGENIPPDGNALKEVMRILNEQEESLMALFKGTTSVTYSLAEYTIDPKEMSDQTILRISKHSGAVAPDDLSGYPINFTLNNLTPATPLAPKEAARKEKQRGMRYNIPGKGAFTVTMNGTTYAEGELDITQFGTQEVLVSEIFEDRKRPVKITFYPELGAIESINTKEQ